MIESIFVPKSIGNYFLIPQRILGIEISKTRIRATQLYASGQSVTYERSFEIPIEPDTSVDYKDRVQAALNNLAQNADKPDIVRSAVSSSLAITKELVVPFTDREKIKLMLPFELEGHLPFATSDAIIDFIITHIDTEKKQTSIIAAALQKHHITHHLEFFEKTPFNPHVLTLDIFDLYALYCTIPEYKKYEKPVVIVDINMHTTRLLCITNRQLRVSRAFSKGLIWLATQIAKKLDQTPAKALEDFIRFGLEEQDHSHSTQAVHELLHAYWSEIQLTLQSFSLQLGIENIETLLLMGDITTIPGILPCIAKESLLPTEIFALQELVAHSLIKSTQSIPQTHIISLAAAYPSAITQECNFRQAEFALSTSKKTTEQLVTAITLSCTLLILLIAYSFYKTNQLKRIVNQAEQEAVLYLQEQNLTTESTVLDAFDEAEKKAEEEERLWFAFSRQRRFSFLEHLQKLSEAIDRASIGLDLKKLVISENSITLDGKVKDYEALKIFERELRESNLFSYVPTLQETVFTNMKLGLRKTNEVL